MNRYTLLLCITLGFFVLSTCHSNTLQKEDNLLDKIHGTKLFLPTNLQSFNPHINNRQFVFKTPIKIVTCVNFGCGECINSLSELYRYIESQNRKDISLIVYADVEKGYSGIYTFLTLNPDFKYPIFIDSTNIFIDENKLSNNNLEYHAFLLGKNNEIIVAAPPYINRNELKKVYDKELAKLLKSDL